MNEAPIQPDIPQTPLAAASQDNDSGESPAPDTHENDSGESPACKTRIIAVANQKGGVGKTTTVINIAASLAERQLKILVIDLDPQANATSGLGLYREEGGSLYRALIEKEGASKLIKSTVVDGVDIIPSELDLAGAEIDVARSDNYLHCVNEALRPLRDQNTYDYVLIDCPPSLGILTMNALTASDALIVPMQCEYYALEGLSVIHRLIDQLHEGGANPRLKLEGILMTMFDARTNLATQVVKEVNRHFGEQIYETVIPRNVRLGEAPSYGKPITQYAPYSAGAEAYRKFADDFLKRQGIDSAKSGKKGGKTKKHRIPVINIHKIEKESAAKTSGS